jgi:hypothetical protein
MTEKSEYDISARESWKSFNETIELLGILDKGIFAYLKEGLQPFIVDSSVTTSATPLGCPSEHHAYYVLSEKRDKKIKDIRHCRRLLSALKL